MMGELPPEHFGDVADDGVAFGLGHGDLYFAGSGTQRAPNAGSLCGVGGSCQAPVAGGRTSADTCTSSRNGVSALIACSRAPLKSSDASMVKASTPLARAQAAKTGLYRALLPPRWNMVPSSRPPNMPS